VDLAKIVETSVDDGPYLLGVDVDVIVDEDVASGSERPSAGTARKRSSCASTSPR
jgi:hypothetical protein